MTFFPMRRRPFPAALLTLAALLLGACASYQAGAPAGLPFQSLYVRPAAKETFAPQAQALLSGQVREAFLRDSRVRLVASEEEADAVVEIALADYTRSPGSRLREDTVRAVDFELSLTARVSLYSVDEERHLFRDRVVRETQTAYARNPFAEDPGLAGFGQAEYNAMPLLTRGLARRIADTVLGGW
jgi:hypothetical protein